MYNVTLRCVRATIVVVEKQLTLTQSESMFVALGIHHSMRMSRIILSFVTCLALQYFCTLSHERQDFRKSY